MGTIYKFEFEFFFFVFLVQAQRTLGNFGKRACRRIVILKYYSGCSVYGGIINYTRVLLLVGNI